MAADKRNFDDYENFPGNVNKGTGYHEFPILKHIDSMNRIRTWQIFIRLIKDNHKRLSGIDWSLLNEIQVPIKNEYYGYNDNYKDLPTKIITEVWTETGIESGKITRNSPTYFTKIALEGRVNQRNQLHQALIYARSHYLKRVERGGNAKGNKKTSLKNVNVKYFPMLAKTYKDGEKHLVYPLFVQPKLDGMRCLVYLSKKDGGPENVIIYTRTLKDYPDMEHMKTILYPYLNDLFDETNIPPQSIYLDGELYKHGKALQDISRDSRRSQKNRLKKRSILDNDNKMNSIATLDEINEYHIYDCFYPTELDTIYESRKEQVEELFRVLSSKVINKYGYAPTDLIKSVCTWEAKSKNDIDKIYQMVISNGYEGVILRNKDGVYLANSSKTGSFMRSKNLVKLKQRFTSEFEVIGYTEGKRGKDKGAIIWIAKTSSGVEFNITPKDTTYEERYKIFKDCKKNFDTKYKNRMITVEYEDLSKLSVPLRAKALLFRDYE
jgi:hypothetical protein